MAKHHASMLPHSASTAHSSPTSPPSASQWSLQLKQNLALLAHNDPDTRRRSMEALKQFIESELDSRSMPGFLEQVSGEAGKSNSGHAISLFAEVARIQKEATVPFIPRIMAAVLRTLASSSGSANHRNNLHHACAKVVASVARYTIEPASSFRRNSLATDVLDSLCQPLLGLLSSNVEPVAVGSAACLQAIVEAENWKLAAPELVDDVCARSSISLVEKGKHSVAHMHLIRSLAKVSSGALQEFAPSLLNAGAHVLVAIGGKASGCGSWQQRAAAAQLLGTIIGSCDHRLFASELSHSIKALENCRLDRVATVRQAVGEAHVIAKGLVSEVDPLLVDGNYLVINSTSTFPSKSRLPEPQKRATHKNSISRAESCGSTISANDFALASQESKIVSYVSSPSSSVISVSSSSVQSPSPPPSEKSTARMLRSHLLPAKRSPVHVPSLIDKHVAEADSVLAHAGFPDFSSENTLAAKAGDGPGLSQSDDLRYLLNSSKSKVSNEEFYNELFINTTDVDLHVSDFQCNHVMEEGHVELDSFNTDACGGNESGANEWGEFLGVSEKDLVCKLDDGRHTAIWCKAENEKNTPEHVKMMVENHVTIHGRKHKKGLSYEMTKDGMSSEDFLIFSTPRRLVQSLQSVSSTPDSKCSPEKDHGMDVDWETRSESGWSIRDNPIAGDHEDDSPRDSSINGHRQMLTSSAEGPPLKELFCQSCSPEEVFARCSESPNRANSAPMTTSSNQSLHKASSYRHGSLNRCTNELAYGRSRCHKVLDKSEDVGLSGLSKSREWSHCVYVLRNVHFYVETFLLCILLLVLGFTVFITVLTLNGQHGIHSLVPT